MQLPSLCGNLNLKHAFSDYHSGESGCLILSGPSGSGKRTAARDIAMGLLCTRSPAPCGCCGACTRVKAGSHPDFELFNPEGEEIKVDAVRSLRTRSFVRPSEAECKVFIVCFADKMNVQSQNALLKVLEEPASSVFILLCENIEKLLPTVRSRGLHYRMEPLTEDELRKLLASHFPTAAPADVERAIAQSGGFYGAAAEFLQGEHNETTVLARSFTQALEQGELAVFRCCMEAGSLSRDNYALFCDALCTCIVGQLRHGGGAYSGFLPALYEYVASQREKTALNASVTALSGALAAFCGENLTRFWRK